jgi:hypothetical protein
MRFASADGERTRALGSRVVTMFGAGFGSTDGFGTFAGAWTDIIGLAPTRGGTHPNPAIEGIAFVGVAGYGLQVAYDYFVKYAFDGLDAYGNYGGAAIATDGSYAPGAGSTGTGLAGNALVAYHESGASLIYTRRQRSNGETATTVRAQLQPLKQWLDARFGLPMIALQRIPDRIGEGDTTNAAASFRDPGGAGGATDTELGSDNLLDAGVRAHAVFRASPTFAFRRAELGKYTDVGRATLAARAFAFDRGDSVLAGLDAFVQYAFSRAGRAREESVGIPIAMSASYSYNSPDSSTFVPLPYAHVFGLQFVLGVPEIAKPLVPIVRPLTAKRADDGPQPARAPREGVSE